MPSAFLMLSIRSAKAIGMSVDKERFFNSVLVMFSFQLIDAFNLVYG